MHTGHGSRAKAPPRHPESAVVALAAFAVYALLTPPASGGGDSSEFALVLATGGVAHPTGYPLYTLAGHAFVALLHACGIAYPFAAALWSAVGGGVAVFFLHALASTWAFPERPDAAHPPLAWRLLVTVLPVALFAFMPVTLAEATQAEVNIWSLAWTCAAAYVFARLARGIGAGAAHDRRWSVRAAAVWGLVCGAGLAHHVTSIWVSLALTAALVVALARRRQLAARLPAIAFVAALVPLLSYTWIAWHAWHPARIQWHELEPTWQSVWNHVTAAQYRAFLGRFAPQGMQRELVERYVYPFLCAGFALLAVVSLRARGASDRVIAWGVGAAAAIATAFVFRYGVRDPAPYFLSPMALGATAAAPVIASIRGMRSRVGLAVLAAAAIGVGVLMAAWFAVARESFDGTMMFERTIHSMWSSIPPDTAIVSWADDRFNRLVEYQVFRGEKPAVRVITPDMLYSNNVRHEFVRRFGADPVAGTDFPGWAIGTPDEAQAIQQAHRQLIERLNARVRVPVIVFDPTVPIVVQLEKPGQARDTTQTHR